MINKRISINKMVVNPEIVICFVFQTKRENWSDRYVHGMSQILDGIQLIQRGNQGVF